MNIRGNPTRRSFLRTAAAIGAVAAWGRAAERPPAKWKERRELFPEGVASGDPDHQSVILWTRVTDSAVDKLYVEVAEDDRFTKIVSNAATPVSADADWTTRVLVGGLKPAHVYWFRFMTKDGSGSRIGRTITAPDPNDSRPVRFVFVSCQNANQGAQNAYRRMIYEDERAPENEQLGFVLHLGDFIYEIVWYSEDRKMMYDRRIRDIVRYADGEKIEDFHIPTTLADYRAVYKAYLHDPDLQDARARWPFVPMWDNHEFSWQGFQGMQRFSGKTRPAQTKKVAANQAFFEFQPARMARPTSKSLETFDPPTVKDTPVTKYDEHGLGEEPNNLTAINSLRGYRTLRWGKHVDLIITDQRSYASLDRGELPQSDPLDIPEFPGLLPEEDLYALDAGQPIADFKEAAPPRTILGATQKAWFLDQLRASKATWKIWGNTIATIEMRVDPQNLPEGLTKKWRGAGFAGFGGGDFGNAFSERGEICDFIEQHGITGFAVVSGDRHSFWAGLEATALPPKEFKPVGLAFVTGSLSAPGLVESYEYNFPKNHPLRALYIPEINMLLKHGVRSCLEYARSGDAAKARELSNPDLAPHVSFVDMGGHGYGVVRAAADSLETEFVGIPRPLERSERADGGPLNYRVRSSAKLWAKGESPKLKLDVLEGDPKLSI
jgi:alkaline phosphatase D